MGGDGDDTLEGRGGDDALFGGSGADAFVFDGREGDDVIHDFELGIDKLAFEGQEIRGLDDLTITAVNAGGDSDLADTRIEDDSGTWSITLLDVDAETLMDAPGTFTFE